MKKMIIVLCAYILFFPSLSYADIIKSYVFNDNTYNWNDYYRNHHDSYYHYSPYIYKTHRYYSCHKRAQQYRINDRTSSYKPLRTVRIKYDPIRYRPLGGYRYTYTHYRDCHVRQCPTLYTPYKYTRGRVVYCHCGIDVSSHLSYHCNQHSKRNE